MYLKSCSTVKQASLQFSPFQDTFSHRYKHRLQMEMSAYHNSVAYSPPIVESDMRNKTPVILLF